MTAWMGAETTMTDPVEEARYRRQRWYVFSATAAALITLITLIALLLIL